MKKGLIKSITAFLQKIVGVIYNEAEKHADSVVLAIEWLQGVIEANEDKINEATTKPMNRTQHLIFIEAVGALPKVLKGTKEVQEFISDVDSEAELFEKIKGKILLEANEKRKFYTDLAATLLIRFVPVPYWVAVILTQFAFGKIFKA